MVASRTARPEAPTASPTARAVVTATQPVWTMAPSRVSSKSRPWARVALARTALAAPAFTLVPMSVLSGGPPSRSALSSTARPKSSRDEARQLPRVSSMSTAAFAVTARGNVRAGQTEHEARIAPGHRRMGHVSSPVRSASRNTCAAAQEYHAVPLESMRAPAESMHAGAESWRAKVDPPRSICQPRHNVRPSPLPPRAADDDGGPSRADPVRARPRAGAGHLGGRVAVRPTPALSLSTGASYSDPTLNQLTANGTEFGITSAAGYFVVDESATSYTPRTMPPACPDATAWAGTTIRTSTFPSTIPDTSRREITGLYVMGEQMVFREGGPGSAEVSRSSGRSSTRRRRASIRYPGSDPGGASYRGLLPGRDRDTRPSPLQWRLQPLPSRADL